MCIEQLNSHIFFLPDCFCFCFIQFMVCLNFSIPIGEEKKKRFDTWKITKWTKWNQIKKISCDTILKSVYSQSINLILSATSVLHTRFENSKRITYFGVHLFELESFVKQKLWTYFSEQISIPSILKKESNAQLSDSLRRCNEF